MHRLGLTAMSSDQAILPVRELTELKPVPPRARNRSPGGVALSASHTSRDRQLTAPVHSATACVPKALSVLESNTRPAAETSPARSAWLRNHNCSPSATRYATTWSRSSSQT